MTARKYKSMLVKIEGKLARVTLNRPEALNSMPHDRVLDMEEIAAALAQDRSVRVVAFTGAGRAFSAGIDLKALAKGEIGEAYLEPWERFLHRLETMDKIVLCLLHGYFIGGGLQLALEHPGLPGAAALAHERGGVEQRGRDGDERQAPQHHPRHAAHHPLRDAVHRHADRGHADHAPQRHVGGPHVGLGLQAAQEVGAAGGVLDVQRQAGRPRGAVALGHAQLGVGLGHPAADRRRGLDAGLDQPQRLLGRDVDEQLEARADAGALHRSVQPLIAATRRASQSLRYVVRTRGKHRTAPVYAVLLALTEVVPGPHA